ncbi:MULTISPECIES: hypothetical protein [unclassified Yersinia (in: enterobacteria)]|uniref:hypothetical protein n=1 Tax=unclassified Yersinia (in: enterobacteria) TaxID=2653513 RepID=UPI00355B1FBD
MQKIGDIPNSRADNNGEFTDGNVAGGVPPTILPAEWFNTLQRELMSVLSAANIDADSEKFDQVATAVSKLITDGGFLKTANNLVEIKNAGAAAVASTLLNLGLGDAAHLPQLTGVVGTSRNAKMSVTAASSTATFTADELIVQTALGGRQYKLISFNKAINLATTGAGGMDTGTAPAAGFVALYAIYNPTTQVSALLAVNSTSVLAPEVYGGANMPSGYTASALVSVWGTASSLLKIGFQSHRHVAIQTATIYSVSSGTTAQTPLGVSPVAPPNATQIDIAITVNETVAGNGVALSIGSSLSGIGQFGAISTVTGQTATSITTGTLSLIEIQRLYFSMSNTNPGTYIIAGRGYDF